MLSSRHYPEFWSWYMVPAPTSFEEESQVKLTFLQGSKISSYKAYIDWLVSTGQNVEYVALDDSNSFALVNGDMTDTYDKQEKLLEEVIGRMISKLDGKVYVPVVKKENMKPIRETLYSVDSKGKTRVFDIELSEVEGIFIIARKTGLLDGKITDQPVVNITDGKVKRSPQEQAQLQYDAYLKKQRDKGYKSLADLGIDSVSKLSASLGTKKTSSQGYNKPMGAKDLNDVADKTKVIDGKEEFIYNDKIDGIRTLTHREDDELIFKSRGGGVFKGCAEPFKKNKNLLEIIKKYNCEIDGEFYKHGLPLNIISGACRLDNYDPDRHDILQLYIFDLPNETSSAYDRSMLINQLADEIDDPQLVFVKQIPFKTMEEYEVLAADSLVRGLEGAIIKRSTELYQFGKKNSAMWKDKPFQDDEFLVTGWEPGLRGTEDMVFTLVTKDGVKFRAKPIGDRAAKEEYVKNMDSLVGQYGTVKFFYYTTEGTPFLPSFIAFRPMKDGEVQL